MDFTQRFLRWAIRDLWEQKKRDVQIELCAGVEDKIYRHLLNGLSSSSKFNATAAPSELSTT